MSVGRADSRPVTSPSGCLSSRILWILVAGWKQRRGLSATALMPGMFHPVLLMAAAQLRNGRKPPAQTMRWFFFSGTTGENQISLSQPEMLEFLHLRASCRTISDGLNEGLECSNCYVWWQIKCIAFVDTCVSGQVTAAVSVCLAGHECSGSTFYKGNI